MSILMPEPKNTLLGKDTVYSDQYNPGLLQPISRALGRDAIGDHHFKGVDIWRLYELSWLNSQGVPQTAVAELFVPASTHSIVESKSLKLYAGSFAMTQMGSQEEVANRMSDDLSLRLGGTVKVKLFSIQNYPGQVKTMPGLSLDHLTLPAGGEISTYETEPGLLEFDPHSSEIIQKTFSTTVFRSLCPVTGQPDLASVMINYKGRAISPEGLLKYLVSYRCHKGFHEQCVEQIYHDMRTVFQPELLEVYASFTRRGGIDINPFRSSVREQPDEVIREMRQ